MVTRANPVNSKKDTCQLYRYYLVFFIQLCECYSRCDWSLPITYWSTDTRMTSMETCFLCLVQHGAWFWKCWWDYFGLSQWKPWKKFSRRYLQTRNYGETETKRVLDNLRMSELQEIFTTVAIVCHRHERLAVCKMFSPLLCFEHEKTSKKWMQVKCK